MSGILFADSAARARPSFHWQVPRSAGSRAHRLVGWLVMTTHMAATVAVRPAATSEGGGLSSLLASRSSSRGHYFDTQIMLSGRVRGSKKPVMKCMKRREETRGEVPQRRTRYDGRVNISVKRKRERTKSERADQCQTMDVCLSVHSAVPRKTLMLQPCPPPAPGGYPVAVRQTRSFANSSRRREEVRDGEGEKERERRM